MEQKQEVRPKLYDGRRRFDAALLLLGLTLAACAVGLACGFVGR